MCKKRGKQKGVPAVKTLCIDEEISFVKRRRAAEHCSRDVDGDCPYANESGGCFGFCMRDILVEKNRNQMRPFEKDGLF